MKLLLVCLVLGIVVTQGAVVPLSEQDAFLDMLDAFLASPDQYTTALGFQRSKRATCDKELNLERIGATVCIKYIDPSDQKKGGRADVTIANLKKLIPRAKSEKVHLVINFDGGDSALDGLFSLSIDYELNHANLETGTAKIVRTKEGDLWKTVVSTASTNNPAVKLIHIFEATLKSDRKTMLQGTYKCEDGYDYKLNVNRVPGESIKAVLEGAGRKYVLNGQVDPVEKTLKVDLDANGLDYEVDLDFNDKAEEWEMKVGVNLGASGAYKVEVQMDKDYGGAGIKVEFNGRAIVNAKLKGKMDKDNHVVKYELRYTAVGLGEGKVRFGLVGEPNQELKIQYLPKTGLDLKIEVTRDVHDDGSRHWKGVITRGPDTYIQYTNDLIPTFGPDSYQLAIESALQVDERSKLYPIFCTYGCFKQRTLSAKLFVDKAAPYKLSMDLDVTKDDEHVFNLDLNTRNNPKVFKLVAPRLLPKVTDDGRDTFEISADHNPGQYLKITSNSPRVKSLKIENIGGDVRRVELNGKELFKGSFAKGKNQITQSTELPDGRKLTTTIGWATEDAKKNKVTLKLDGTERQFDGFLDWDVTVHEDMHFNLVGKGQNKWLGAYSFERHSNVKCDHGKHMVIEHKGNTKMEKMPWFKNVDTDISADLDFEHRSYSGKLMKSVDGKPYRLTLQNGRLSVDVN